MNPMHKRRLLKLAKHLRTSVPRNRFNMLCYTDLFNPAKTTGCAAAHARDIFRRQGYRCEGAPSYRELTGVAALNEFFGLGAAGHAMLFSAYLWPSTPKQIAKRIEDYVKGQP